MVEHLPSMCEALGLALAPQKKTKPLSGCLHPPDMPGAQLNFCTDPIGNTVPTVFTSSVGEKPVAFKNGQLGTVSRDGLSSYQARG